MNTVKIGRDFEIEALYYLKKKFKHAIWLSKDRQSIFDFVCEDESGEVYYGDAKVESNGGSPTLTYEQRTADFVIVKSRGKIIFIWKSNFKNNVLIEKEKSEYIRISPSLKAFLDKKKIQPRETYDNVIKRLLQRRGIK